jgi:hypothetical protein
LITTDLIAEASLVVAVAALGLAAYSVFRANKTTSAATLVALNEAFRQAWERSLRCSPTEPQLKNEIAELLNLLEIACAVYLEKSISGNSRSLLVEYLNNVFAILIKTPSFSSLVPKLMQTENTFIFIKKFLNRQRRILSVTVPPQWYELQY